MKGRIAIYSLAVAITKISIVSTDVNIDNIKRVIPIQMEKTAFRIVFIIMSSVIDNDDRNKQ